MGASVVTQGFAQQIGSSAQEKIQQRGLSAERPGAQREMLPEIQIEKSPPSTEELKLPPLQSPSEKGLSSQLKVYVNAINITGNTVFSGAELSAVVKPYTGRTLTNQELQELRQTLTRYYVDRGYINSGAIIPDQALTGDIIEVRIIEGRLTQIEIIGNDWLRDSYIKERLMIEEDMVLNINELQTRIQLLHQDRRIERINAELGAGLRIGESILRVRVQESRLYDMGLLFNNWRSPAIGSLVGEVYGGIYNLTGFGDELTARYELSEGLDDWSATYSFPLTAYGTRLGIFYDKSDSDVVEKPFDSLDITAETESYGFILSHPFYQTPTTTFIASILLEKRRSETSLLGMPFSFSPGAENGRTKLTVLRLMQEWIDRSQEQVLSARSTFSVGIDAFDATTNSGDIPDGRFFAWLGQFQWVRRLGNTDNQVLIRSDLQLAAQSLLPLEKFGLGGATTVRGYRENLFVRDNAWVSSIEFRFPVFRLPIPGISKGSQDGTVQLAAFYDFGWSENTDQPTFAPRTISSPGIGLRWDPHQKIHGEIYWGIALRKIDTGGEHDIQDSGIHFLLNVQFP